MAYIGVALAGGPFGPPQSISKDSGGMNTGLGYWYYADKFHVGDNDYVIRQNQIYTQACYGTRYWEVYGRITAADLKINDAFSPTAPSTDVSKNYFSDDWNFAGTLGVKGFYPIQESSA